MTSGNESTQWTHYGPRGITWALELALRELDGPPRDQAAVALARRYALDIDEAELVHEQVRRLLSRVEALDPDLAEQLQTLSVRVESTHVLATLGPKLNTILVDLGMTPRARQSITGKGGGGGVPPTKSPLALVRGDYARRTAGVDAS